MAAKPANAAANTYDYVIVGAGAAGCVLANRLTEDGRTTVCVLEAGPPDRSFYIHLPVGFIKIIFNPAYTWQFKSEPTENTGNRAIATLQGRTIGGSSSINGLVYNRGQRADYDSWAQRGNRGWSYAEILPYFKRSERRVGGDDRFRGRNGPVPVSDIDWINPVCEAFIAGAVGLGIPRNPDYNGASQAGVGYFQRIIDHGWRVSAAGAFLKPARRRLTLDVRTYARAVNILFDGKRAKGVRFAYDTERNTYHDVHARREVILCSGTVNTPRLLQVSGIGPARLLGDIGVPVLHELPGVGENFRDHYSVRLVARARNVKTINELARGIDFAGQVARWMLGRPSILALSPSLVHIFWRSHDTLEEPDLQGVFTPASYKAGFVSLLDDYPGMTCGFWQHRPASTGYVRARSTDPYIDPIIQPNYLADPSDWQVLLGGMRLARRLLQTPQLSAYVEGEQMPGPGVNTDDEFLDYARRVGTSSWHLVGTAQMGPASNPLAVVDEQLRVHGLDGLRVADASVMPVNPSANTYAATLMIAEKASDMIRGRNPLPPEDVAS